jgi:hypothetical protein
MKISIERIVAPKMSLKLALEQLGFGPRHHMSEVLNAADDPRNAP